MSLPPGLERRQLRLLSRDGVRRLLGSAVFSRTADPMLFAIWALALAAIPPAGFAARRSFAYMELVHRPLDAIAAEILLDRALPVIYAMLAAALLAALTWEALLPDRDDHEVIGALPVRPRTLAASRLVAAIAIVTGLAVTVSAPSGAILALLSIPRPDLGFPPLLLLGSIVSAVLGAWVVFLALLVARVLLAAGVGARTAERMATLLQVVTIVGLFELFLFLPGVMPRLVASVLDGTAGPASLPFVWFIALGSWIGGGDIPIPGAAAATGAVAAALAVGVAAVTSLGLAARIERRSLEFRQGQRAGRVLPWLAGTAAAGLRAAAPVRALLVFAVASLTRSRRHLLVVATYLGFAVAACAVSLVRSSLGGALALGVPSSDVLALAPILIYVLTLGVRAAFMIPTDLDANWPLRLHQAGARQARAATMLAALVLITGPVALLEVVVGLAAGWAPAATLAIGGITVLSGAVVVELAFWNWNRVPFASDYAPRGEALKRWMTHVAPLVFFTTVTVASQLDAIETPTGPLYYLAAGLAGLAVLRGIHRLRHRAPDIDFDAPSDAAQTLQLSDASS